MALSYAQLKVLLRGRRLPAAFVDLDALDRNVDRVVEQIRGRGTPLRVASKSVRVVAILRRLMDRSAGLFQGLMCFSVEEAEFLAEQGFDDLLVAYPAFQRCDIERAIHLVEAGKTISLMADCRQVIDRIAEVAQARASVINVVLCVDMSLKIAAGRVHLGVRRSPLHSVAEVVDLARYVAHKPGTRFLGLMGYEAQVAGLGDDNPHAPMLNPFKALIRRASVRELSRRRSAMVAALIREGLAPALVNGGGSGSLDTTTPDSGVTEVTAGSAFFKPHLFDYYKSPHMRALEPSCFFALEVTRRPTDDVVTCLGGGYVASGPASRDKVPMPWLPAGLHLLGEEMCGEVQTPLRLDDPTALQLGDPVIFRHAKGGELAERFEQYLLIAGGEVVDCVPTYRGQGRCFF